MPLLPGDLTTITVTGHFPGGDGVACTGNATFTPSTNLVYPAGNTIIPASPRLARLYGGMFTIAVICTDNAGISPQPWYWIVTLNIDGADALTQTYAIPATLGASVDLADLVEVTPGPTMTGYIVTASPMTVTGTPAADDVLTATSATTAQWQPGGGGTASSSVQGATAFGISSSAGAASTYSRGDHQHGTPPAPTAASVGADAAGAASAALAAALASAAATYVPLAGGTMSGPLAMGGNKVTSLANGTASTDAAAFGQIPTSLPPSGAAGGDLTGSYPNPTVSATANFKAQVETVRLDQMAAPTAAVSLNSQKVTSLANGTASTDAAAFGQIPTAGNVSALGTFGAASANGAAATYSRSDHSHGAPDAYTWDSPHQRGWSEWNFAPSTGVAVSQNFTSGTIYGISFIAQTNNPITKVGVQVVSSAGTPTSGQNMIGLYTISGTTATQATATGDLGTWSAATFQSYALGASQTMVAGATYLLLFMSNATTPVHLQGITSDTAAQIGFLNLGLSNTAAPWLKFFVYGTAQTALPASFTISGATMSATNALAPWACLL